MSEREGMVVVVALGLVGLVVAEWLRSRERARAIPQGLLGGFAVGEVAFFLMAQYRQGLLHPRALEAAKQRSRPLIDPLAQALNSFVCLEVASGRYREALEWRTRWAAKPRGDSDALLKINEAEALACLGKLEESLALVEPLKPRMEWIRIGRAAHRAWVLAELGRVEEAHAQLAAREFHPANLFPPEYVAELWFSRYAVGLVARDFEAARAALVEAERFVVRESSRRNLHFFRGRIAFAQGKYAEAVDEFTRGGESVYRAQGGASLVEWGAALMQLGRQEEAREKWQRCLVEDPQSPAATTARDRLADHTPHDTASVA